MFDLPETSSTAPASALLCSPLTIDVSENPEFRQGEVTAEGFLNSIHMENDVKDEDVLIGPPNTNCYMVVKMYAHLAV